MKTWRVQIRSETVYRYEKPVGFSPHLVRLLPRTEPGRLAHKIHFSTNAKADVQFRRDLFDNNYARCFYRGLKSELCFNVLLEMELQEVNAFDFLLENYAAEFPFQYREEDKACLAPYLSTSTELRGESERVLPLAFWPIPEKGTSTVTMLLDIVGAIHKHIAYERREDGPARSPSETVSMGSGACRDTAVLLAAMLREIGLAARLVSGYLFELDAAAADRRAEGAMHMWTETYVPGAGWIGLDPTNGVFCNHNHIAAAVGLVPADITPISGKYFSPENVPAEMTSSLELTPLHSPHETDDRPSS